MWYRICFNPDLDIMGCDTQIKNLHGDALEFKDRIKEVTFRHHLTFDKILNYVELKSKAKFTDILWEYSLQGRALFISEKARMILEDYKLLNAAFYPTIVKKGSQSRNYYCIRLSGDISHRVDYRKSEFMWYKSEQDIDYPLVFCDAAEMLNKKKDVGSIDSIRALNCTLKIVL
jgi:hypothetical protein